MAAAMSNDPALAARIVRNLGQIEADFFHSAWSLSERLMHEAFLAISQVAQAPWDVSEVDWSTRIVCPEWKMTKGVGTGDMWLELGDLSPDPDGYERSWLATALKTASTQLCIIVKFRRGLQDLASELLRDDKMLVFVVPSSQSLPAWEQRERQLPTPLWTKVAGRPKPHLR